ncbi:protein NO VEIN domain-containing protein [Lysinibacillus sp. NPDC093197]|uniref:protein NO VEIN domain-containing protein n=1 Tax=Lysinibacillus sp. NPDC093197 TaxID=3364132 RepID=UPI00380D1A53
MKYKKFNDVYPNQSLIHYPLVLELYKRGGKAKANEIYEPLADYFELSDDLRKKTVNENTKELKWHNNVRWARQQLVDKGILKNDSDRGVWELGDNAINSYSDIDIEHAMSEDTVKGVFTQDQLDSLLEKQKKIGELGELIVEEYEKNSLISKGFTNLAEKVKRVSPQNCREGYDIISFYEDGSEKYIEVKGSTSTQLQFYISINEFEKAKKLGDQYCIALVRGIDLEQKKCKEIKEINNFNQLIEANKINLVPIKWRVSLGEN